MQKLYNSRIATGGVSLSAGTIDSYRKVLTDRYGEALSQQSIDNVVYKYDPVDGNFYRLIEDEVRASRYGVSPQNTAKQNSDNFDIMMLALHRKSKILLDEGEYDFEREIVITDFQGSIRGQGSSTILFIPASSPGMRITRKIGYNFGSYSDFEIHARGKDPLDDGTLGIGDLYGYESNVGSEFNADGYRYNGLTVEAVSYISNILVSGFSGHNVKVRGNVGPPTGSTLFGTDSSMSKFTNVKAKEGNACGFYITGNDSNVINFDTCVSKDHRLVGFYDNSFLGNKFDNCQTDSNRKGGFRQTNPNGRTVLVNCYTEGGVDSETGLGFPPDTIGPHSVAISGNHANGLVGGLWLDGKNLSDLKFGGLRISKDQLGFFGDNYETGFYLQSADTQANRSPHWRWQTGNYEYDWAGYVAAGAVIGGIPSRYPWGDRIAINSHAYFSDISIGGTRQFTTDTIPFIDIKSTLFPGDNIVSFLEGSNQIREWRCSQPGLTNPPAIDPTTKLTTLNNNILTVTPANHTIVKGAVITLENESYVVSSYMKLFDKILYKGNYFALDEGVVMTKLDGSQIIPGVDLITYSEPNDTMRLSHPLPDNTPINTVYLVRYSSYDTREITFSGFADDRSTLIMNRVVPVVNNVSLEYAKAHLTPMGTISGTTAERPTLNYPGHEGMHYWNKTTLHDDIWDGTNWIT